MPQMSPLWWLSLMLTFNLMIMVYMSLLYFNYKTSIKFLSLKKKMNFIWKW
uniref:ATP synthase F0 subunit 8 n=1 Tax=Tricentrus longivalvulatus TaxID=2913657 RepID=UPI001EE11003|nr:ATP synthase F0 subunit 8 [Tricentrus longivalvulatus]UKB86925.1 ATP synthase F0 subunit 8 [Tricentrus longivalvulatus]